MTLAKEKKDENQSPATRSLQRLFVQPWRESRAEMKKVVWPTREETIRLTVVVIVLSLVISLLLFAADSLFAWLLLLLQSAVSSA